MSIENDGDLQETIRENGKAVYVCTWDSGAPGGGGGIDYVYEYAGSYYFAGDGTDDEGPFPTLTAVFESIGMPLVTEASQTIECEMASLDELMGAATISVDRQHHMVVNGTRVLVDPSGEWRTIP